MNTNQKLNELESKRNATTTLKNSEYILTLDEENKRQSYIGPTLDDVVDRAYTVHLIYQLRQ